jgi:transcriptional regulator with XRE-family HTH domain
MEVATAKAQMPQSAKSRRGRSRVASIEGPDPVDIHVGGRIRLRRTLLGLSQTKLGEVIGLTFQQVKKYERGSNRVSASMLYRIAEAIDVPVSFFFDDMARGGALRPQGAVDDYIVRRESLELLCHYYAISDVLRREVYALVKAMAGRKGGPQG